MRKFVLIHSDHLFHRYEMMYFIRQSNISFANETVETTTSSEAYFVFTTSFYSNRIKFWILLVLQLLSLSCFVYVFSKFVFKKQFHQTIHNHVVILLLSVSFLFVTVALSLTLAYLYTSQVYPASVTFCTLWNWFHYSVNIINMFLMAFASIERNWLIFYPNVVKNKVRKFLLHYCPLAFCVLYPPIFYASAMSIHQCAPDYNFTQLLCKWPCYFYNQDWTNVDLFFNNYTPLCTIPVFCSAIYIRVLIQRRKMRQQRFKWRQDKKLILQIWVLSSLYLALWMPVQLTGLINLYWSPTFLLQEQIDYIYLFPYLIHIIYPYVVLLSFHQETVKRAQQTATVFPMTIQRKTMIQ